MTRLSWIILLSELADAAFLSPSVSRPPQTFRRKIATTAAPSPTALSKTTPTPGVFHQNQVADISLPGASGTWMSIPCDASGVVNENPDNMTQRYDAAGVRGQSSPGYPHLYR